jgi:amino acid transporter
MPIYMKTKKNRSMYFCICTIPEIISILLIAFLTVYFWRYKKLRAIVVFISITSLIATYVFLGYIGFIISLLGFFILRKQKIYQKNRARLLKYFSR